MSRGSGRDLYLRRPLKKKSRANPTPLRTISSSIAVKSWSFPYTHTHTQIVFNFCRTEDVRDWRFRSSFFFFFFTTRVSSTFRIGFETTTTNSPLVSSYRSSVQGLNFCWFLWPPVGDPTHPYLPKLHPPYKSLCRHVIYSFIILFFVVLQPTHCLIFFFSIS